MNKDEVSHVGLLRVCMQHLFVNIYYCSRKRRNWATSLFDLDFR